MGQKVNPIGLRVSVNKNWRSRWYADKRAFGNHLHEDLRIRSMIKERLKDAAVADVLIERYANRARVTIFTARPGIVIGKRGADVEKLREEISEFTNKEIYIGIREIKHPDLSAQLVAENIANQLLRRVAFRRAMKRALQMTMELGAHGIKIECNGRLNGAELARRESYKQGKIPLHTLRENIDYGTAVADTTYGNIGVKVWICKSIEQEEGVRDATNA